jgi:coenzyme F420-0:L-glutamate ligase
MIKPGENLIEVVQVALRKQRIQLDDGDVLALASKIVSYSQGRIVDLKRIEPSQKAKKLAEQYSLEPEFAELVLLEADQIYGGVEKAVLTLKDGIIAPNAGIDNKNAPLRSVVLWPKDLEKWLKLFRTELCRATKKKVGIIIVDSGLIPLRIGTVGLALAVGGFKPIREWRGRKDLYGRTIIITRHAVADDLASAAHLLMGEAAEKSPIVLIKEAPLDFDDAIHGSEEMEMSIKDCIFMNLLAGRATQTSS